MKQMHTEGVRAPAWPPLEAFGKLNREIKKGLLNTVKYSRNEMANYCYDYDPLKSQLHFKLTIQGPCNK